MYVTFVTLLPSGLQTTYLDLYQLHWPERYTPCFGALGYVRANERQDAVAIEEQVAAIGQLIKSGKIRYWGLSNENSFGVTKVCAPAWGEIARLRHILVSFACITTY